MNIKLSSSTLMGFPLHLPDIHRNTHSLQAVTAARSRGSIPAPCHYHALLSVHSNLHEKTKQNRTRSKTTKTNPPSDLSIKTTYWRNLAVQLCDNFIKLVRVCPITVFEESKRADISRLEPSSVLVKLILGRSVKWS